MKLALKIGSYREIRSCECRVAEVAACSGAQEPQGLAGPEGVALRDWCAVLGCRTMPICSVIDYEAAA